MKIAIDCRSLRKKPAGVSNFLIAVINHLTAHRKDCTFYLVSNEDFNDEVKKKLKIQKNAISVIAPFFVLSRISTLWYFIKLPLLIRRLDIDIFYSPIPNLPLFLPHRIKTIITVHDMVYKLFPETMSLENKLVNTLIHDRSLREADRIWAISQYTKAEIEKFYPDRKSTSILVGTAVDSTLYRPHSLSANQQAELLRRYDIQPPFILTVGTIEPRKNLHFLSSLAPNLAENNFQIVVVGAKGWGNGGLSTTASKPTRDSIKFLGFIANEDLIQLYNLAAVYVSTSFNEGFCLPLLEAMHCGCPVVAAHNSGMIEVVDKAGETVRGWDTKVWVETIIKTASQRKRYAQMGFAKVQQYQWNEVIVNVSQDLIET